MYRCVLIDMSPWDGMYNPVHPRIREVESRPARTEIAGNAVNGNVLTSIEHTDGQVWLSLPSTLYLFVINWLSHNMFSILTDWLTDWRNQTLNPASAHAAQSNNIIIKSWTSDQVHMGTCPFKPHVCTYLDAGTCRSHDAYNLIGH